MDEREQLSALMRVALQAAEQVWAGLGTNPTSADIQQTAAALFVASAARGLHKSLPEQAPAKQSEPKPAPALPAKGKSAVPKGVEQPVTVPPVQLPADTPEQMKRFGAACRQHGWDSPLIRVIYAALRLKMEPDDAIAVAMSDPSEVLSQAWAAVSDEVFDPFEQPTAVGARIAEMLNA